ncbi:MAG: S41 family peptidase [Francisellaceae bacterium]|jgi:carboxyl-terminal processing protease|nr:S41 family peptidase [Francisellaceae bacterium]MBT6207499.1 S41 family peptidase [Francisellaceae bacterium]MBT6538870.1 S41 family peptidase [Francisellaceae bacterium]
MNKNNIKTVALLFASGILSSTAIASQQNPVELQVPIDDIQRYSTVLEHVKNYYVNSIDDSKLFEDSIRGMLAGLDPHSAYLDQDEYMELKEGTSGKFGGLGIEVVMEDGFVKIISPIDDTPADKAGIEAGDLIIKLDDTPVKGLSMREAVDLMRGKKGTAIILTIIRKGVDHPLAINVKRDIISSASVKHKIFDTDYAYIRVSQFQTDTGEEMKKAILKLNKEMKQNPKGIILDLRNNPGGILQSSVEAADLFLEKNKLNHDGVIVFSKGRAPGTQLREVSKSKDMTHGAPIVVLVNGGTASAGEILTAALQDHQRAIVIGEPTFGKGSVQTVLPLKDQRALKLTTALYYTPSGKSIQAKGIIPDIIIENMKIPTAKENTSAGFDIKESDLNGHLSNAKKTDVKTEKNKDTFTSAELLNKDYQLYEALNLVKAMYLSKGFNN